MSAMSAVEFFFSAVLGYLFWRRRLHLRFPAMGAYLALRVASAPILFVLLSGNQYIASQTWLIAYFYTFWAVYIVSTILLFFICMEVFRAALSAFTGLMKFGLVIFRWAVLASTIVTLSTISFAHRGILIIPDVAFGMMRSVSMIELCLLAFLCLCMNALRLSVKDLAFGIALGFGLMASNDFVMSSVLSRFTSLAAPMQFVYESVILLTQVTWIAYCVMPQRLRRPVMMPANSTIYRWNQIASALGHTGTQIAVPQHSNTFFLTDVEKVVEKVLNKNLKGRESES